MRLARDVLVAVVGAAIVGAVGSQAVASSSGVLVGIAAGGLAGLVLAEAWPLIRSRLRAWIPFQLRSPIVRTANSIPSIQPAPGIAVVHSGHDVTIRVTNNGPKAQYRAEVVDLRGTSDDPVTVTPWSVKWRDSRTPESELSQGQTGVLTLVSLNLIAPDEIINDRTLPTPYTFHHYGGTEVWGFQAGVNSRSRAEWDAVRLCLGVRIFRVDPAAFWDVTIRLGWTEAAIVSAHDCVPVGAGQS